MPVYLIHFDKPYHHARHYLGSAEDLAERIDRHRRGDGAKLLRAVQSAGIGWAVVRVWQDGGRDLEAKFKRAQHNRNLCPVCNPKGSIQ